MTCLLNINSGFELTSIFPASSWLRTWKIAGMVWKEPWNRIWGAIVLYLRKRSTRKKFGVATSFGKAFLTFCSPTGTTILSLQWQMIPNSAAATDQGIQRIDGRHIVLSTPPNAAKPRIFKRRRCEFYLGVK